MIDTFVKQQTIQSPENLAARFLRNLVLYPVGCGVVVDDTRSVFIFLDGGLCFALPVVKCDSSV